MTSTPMHHPDDETQPHAEDQGESASGPHHSAADGREAQASEPAENGDARSQDRTAEDPVDAETKKLSQEEAQQHDSAEDAQRSAAEDGGGYGH